MVRLSGIGFCVFSMIILIGCGDSSDDAPSEVLDESGIFLQILLEDEKGQELSYVLFNPNIKTVDACNASAESSLDDIVQRLPPRPEVPLSWRPGPGARGPPPRVRRG